MDAVEVPQVHTVEKVAPVPQLTVQDTDQLFPTQPREHHLAVLGCEFSNRRTVETVRRFENFHTMTARWCSWGWGGNKCSRQEVVRQVYNGKLQSPPMTLDTALGEYAAYKAGEGVRDKGCCPAYQEAAQRP